MATSSKDIEILWKRYSEEGAKKGISVAEFFESNGVPYNTFEKWYKRKFQQPDIAECRVVGVPKSYEQPSSAQAQESSRQKSISYIIITMSNGVKIEHRRLSYPELLTFVSKLQDLCSL